MPRPLLHLLARPVLAAATAAVTTGLVLLPSPASAAPLPGNCTVAATGLVSCVFGTTGAPQSFVVPAGTTTVTVVATGGSGGAARGNAGSPAGAADTVTADLPVTPGSTLHIVVGGVGQDGVFGSTPARGGYNGGGDGLGTTGTAAGGGGGGASDVRTDPAALSSRLLVAGGGGGGGGPYVNNSAGGAAGQPGGSQGGCAGSVPAQPGSGSAGGAGGYGCLSPGGSGSLGTGGSGTGPVNSGGGGGGGLYGGGGGAGGAYSGSTGAGGGAGGSSLVPAGGSRRTATGPAGVTISYLLPASAPTGVTTVPGDRSLQVSWTPGVPGPLGSPATSSTVTATPGGQSCTTTASSCTITGLVNGTTYSTSVTSTGTGGTSTAAAGADAVPFGPPTPPGTPTLTPTRDGLRIDFAPADGNGRPVLGYRATITRLSDGTVTVVDGPSSPLLAGGLVAGERYSVGVEAVTAAGPGAPGPGSVATVPRTAAPDGVRTPVPVLAATGAPVEVLAVVAAALLAGGAVTTRLGRR